MGSAEEPQWLCFVALKAAAAKIPARTYVLAIPGLDVEQNDGIGGGHGGSDVGILTPLDVSVIQGMRINFEIIAIKKLNSHCCHLTPVLKCVQFHRLFTPGHWG